MSIVSVKICKTPTGVILKVLAGICAIVPMLLYVGQDPLIGAGIDGPNNFRSSYKAKEKQQTPGSEYYLHFCRKTDASGPEAFSYIAA